MKRSPLRRQVHRVTPDERVEYAHVLARDGGCVAPRLDPTLDPCAGPLTRQHVKDGPGGRRITDRRHLVILCAHHHLDGWATSKAALGQQRDYLRREEP